ncbi:MAG: hypothetical protein H6737_12510 [Alphaproteobacteria bacterium]|nr:hypothetical protein [Alphaproteobacteria bacterium]
MVPTLLLLWACKGGGSDVSDEQLRAVSVQIDGVPMIHDRPPDPAYGTSRVVPPAPVDRFPNATMAFDVFGPWGTIEVIGSPAFQLVGDGFFGPDAIVCASEVLGTHDATIVITADDQPGREFRVPLRCEVDDLVRAVPMRVQAVEDDGTTHGDHLGIAQWELAKFDATGLTVWALPDPWIFAPGPVDGEMRVWSSGFLFAHDGESPVQTAAIAGITSARAFAGGAFYVTDGNQLHKNEGVLSTPVGDPRSFLVVEWASADGRYALANSGSDAGDLRTLTLHDTLAGTEAPFVRPDGSPWFTGYAPVGISVAPDLASILVPTSYFDEASLLRLDVATGDETDLLETAVAHVRENATGANGLNLSAWDVTPDHAWAAVVFDSIFADPGGFRQVYSGAYVIEVATGATWLASVGPDGERLAFEGGGFDGALIEHVRISPGGEKVVIAKDVLIDRSAWRPLP